MGFLDRLKGQEKDIGMENIAPKNEAAELKKWGCAKVLSTEDAHNLSSLSPGWYVYKDGNYWYAIRPSGNGLERSSRGWTQPHQIESWLGVKVVIGSEKSEVNGLDRMINQAAGKGNTVDNYPKSKDHYSYFEQEEIEDEEPITDIENRWAEEKAEAELKAIEEDIRDAEALLLREKREVLKSSKKETSSPQKRPRQSLGRTNQVKTRLTDSELTRFNSRVKKSGLTQGEFVRKAILEGEIVIEERGAMDIAILDELSLLRAELGRQGGLLKMITKPSAGMRSLRPDEWNALMNFIRDMDSMKEKISKLEVKFSGNRKTSSE